MNKINMKLVTLLSIILGLSCFIANYLIFGPERVVGMPGIFVAAITGSLSAAIFSRRISAIPVFIAGTLLSYYVPAFLLAMFN